MLEFDVTFPPDGDPADVIVATRGAATMASIMEFREDLVAQPWARGGISMIVDHSLLDPQLFTAGNARDLGATLGAPAQRMGEGTLTALVATSPAVFGILRQMLAYREIAADAAPEDDRAASAAPIAVFPSRDEAAAWLRAQRRPAAAPAGLSGAVG